MTKTISWLLPVAMLATLGACSGDSDTAETDTQSTSEARAVSVTSVQMRSIAGSFTASGLLVPREEAAVGAELAGYKVSDVYFEEGAYVKKGQALARLDAGLLQAKIAQAQANVAQARAQGAQAQSEAARVAGLDGTGILSDEQIQSRRTGAKSASAAVDVALAQLNDLRAQERRMIIRAPVSGTILERSVRPGDVSSPGSPMFRIASGNQIELDAEVPEDTLASLSKGNPATVTLASGTELSGTIRLVSPRVDPQTKLGRVRVQMANSSELRAGGFASARFSRGMTPVPAVPEKAVQFEASGPLLTVIQKDNTARRVEVKTGSRADGFVALVEGPPVGTRVALGGGAFLLDGDKVKPVAARKADVTPASDGN